MTRDEVERSVKTWVAHLGLTTWELNVVWPEDYDKWPEHEDGWPDWGQPNKDGVESDAALWRTKSYQEARLYINPKVLDKPIRNVEQAIVHELLHIVTRDLEFIWDQLDGLLQRDVENVIREAYNHHMEGAIDFLAYRLVDLRGLA